MLLDKCESTFNSSFDAENKERCCDHRLDKSGHESARYREKAKQNGLPTAIFSHQILCLFSDYPTYDEYTI